MENNSYRTWENINLTTLEHNFKTIAARMSGLEVMTVVKANAYGQGVRTIAPVLKQAGSAGFCTATWREAEELLSLGLPVQILGGIFDFELPEVVHAGCIVGITDWETANRFNAEAARQNKKLKCHFKLDTGMGRMGILWQDAPEVIRKVKQLSHLDCCGIYSHFPKIWSGESSFAEEQVKRFLFVLDACNANGIHFDKIHFANSDAINVFDKVRKAPFNCCRAGIGMYGGYSPESYALGLQPVTSLHTRLVAARMMPKGHSIGYERTYILEKDTLVGTIAAGYADGLPLQLSNRGRVLYKGKFCPVIGRISMDYTTIDMSQFSPDEWKTGDTVTLIGQDGDSVIPMEEWANIKQTHAYDILCSVSPRVGRLYTR